MGYYDGNTVTAYWNYAQRFAMSDNSYGTNFGPSTDGAINLISGQINGVTTRSSQRRTWSPTAAAGLPWSATPIRSATLLHHHRCGALDERTERR